MRRFYYLLILITFCASSAVASPVQFSVNGHYYDIVFTQMTWEAAKASAESTSFNGTPGHLATITSSEENSFLNTSFNTGQSSKFAWIGGYEPQDDGVWLWGSGPENGIQFSNGATPTLPFNYANWQGVEPNDFNPGEDFAAFNIGLTFSSVGPGGWIDSPNPNPSDPIVAYIIEYETEDIPALGSYGSLILAILLVSAGMIVMRKRMGKNLV